MQCIKKCTIHILNISRSQHCKSVKECYENTLRFISPLTITNEEIDLGFQRLEYATNSI